ncbi:MAG: 50S ribosomal protein L11 methyltransferase [Streptococcaceae bacterium]|jgi:ribosomal protein L11 methyltransferase|nr:50S ribosomal protein L11 methyltransferase [Streptococcaceae bacterium]
MDWKEIKAVVSNESLEMVSNIFVELGANGVQIEDDLTIESYEIDPFGEIIDREKLKNNTNDTVVTAYFSEMTDVAKVVEELERRIVELKEFGIDIGKNEILVNTIEEESWSEAWKKYYSPKRLTRFLTVVPEWMEYEKESKDELLIKLDPGMAFGTGTHPTTLLTLQALESIARKGETVVDVGTGSGVLSIAANLLGAKEIFAYDLDEVAVNQARENIELNENTENIHLAVGNLLKGVEVKADIILANILADVLILMIEDAKNVLKDDGKMVLSGIITEKLSLLEEELLKNEFVVETHLNMNEWNTLIVSKDNDFLNGMRGG